MKRLQTTTITILIAALAMAIPGCMNSIIPGLMQDERTAAKKIEVKRAEMVQIEKDLVKLKAEVEADPTPENIAAVKELDKETSKVKIELVSSRTRPGRNQGRTRGRPQAGQRHHGCCNGDRHRISAPALQRDRRGRDRIRRPAHSERVRREGQEAKGSQTRGGHDQRGRIARHTHERPR